MKKITNRQAKSYVERLEEFKANNLSAKWEMGRYVVYSYGYWPLWVYCNGNNFWYENTDKYSKTTSCHRTYANPGVKAIPMTRDEMEDFIRFRTKIKKQGVA